MPRLLRLIGLAVMLTGCRLTKEDVDVAQALNEVAQALNDSREAQAVMQERLDSLQTLVAKHDSVLRQIANLSGMPIR